jgi:hypothetical protein
MKQIIAKTDMVNDPMVVKIKAFRLLNKRAGEFKRAALIETDPVNVREENVNQYRNACAKMSVLSKEAEAAGFHLWVNFDGTTGHTYPKDYKITSDLTNDWDAFTSEVNNRNAAAQEIIDGINLDRPDPLMN